MTYLEFANLLKKGLERFSFEAYLLGTTRYIPVPGRDQQSRAYELLFRHISKKGSYVHPFSFAYNATLNTPRRALTPSVAASKLGLDAKHQIELRLALAEYPSHDPKLRAKILKHIRMKELSIQFRFPIKFEEAPPAPLRKELIKELVEMDKTFGGLK